MRVLLILLVALTLVGCNPNPRRSKLKYPQYTTTVYLTDGKTVEAIGTHFIHTNGVLRFYDKNVGDFYVSCEIKEGAVLWWKDHR